jgi:hypothetical protein
VKFIAIDGKAFEPIGGQTWLEVPVCEDPISSIYSAIRVAGTLTLAKRQRRR